MRKRSALLSTKACRYHDRSGIKGSMRASYAKSERENRPHGLTLAAMAIPEMAD